METGDGAEARTPFLPAMQKQIRSWFDSPRRMKIPPLRSGL